MRFQWSVDSKSLTFLLLVNVVLFVLPRLASILSGIEYDGMLYVFGGLVTNLNMLDGEFWRLVTANFLHVGELHLIFNMLALWSIGRIVADYYGGKYLFAFYIVCGIVGGLASIAFAPNTFTVGASASVFGLLGVVIANTRKRHTSSVDFPISLAEVLPMAAYSLLFGFLPNTNINNAGHLGGLIAGLLLGFVFDHKMKFGRKQYERWLENGIFAFAAFAFVLSILIPLVQYTLVILLP
jgi:rhomboid protease GluP